VAGHGVPEDKNPTTMPKIAPAGRSENEQRPLFHDTAATFDRI
jgi:hypothetical protein